MRTLVSRVDVARPLRQVYDQWTQLGDFPRFMPGVRSVVHRNDRTSEWAVVVDRERRIFTAVVTEQVPDVRIAWTTTAGSPAHSGVVDFRPLGEDRTRVTVTLDWEPAGLFDKLGDRLGRVQRHLDRCLRAYARFVAGRDEPTGAWRGTVAPAGGAELPAAISAAAASVTGGANASTVAGGGHFVDDGRGRLANRPSQIPLTGWVDILRRTIGQLKQDNAPVVAAGVAFYFFLALVPSLAAVVSIYGLVADPADVQRQLESVLGGLPSSASQFVEEQLETIVSSSPNGLGFGVAISSLVAVASASKGVVSLIAALNIAYDEDETRKFLRLRLVAGLATLVIVFLVVVGVGGMVVVGYLAERLGPAVETSVNLARWPVLLTLVGIGLAALYRYAPSRDNPKWRWVTPGVLVAVVLWLLGSVGFSLYVNGFGSYNETYGTLAGIIVLLLWLFLTAYSIVLGAEFDAETERQTARDSTTGPDAPLGQRAAFAADTVAPAPAKKSASGRT